MQKQHSGCNVTCKNSIVAVMLAINLQPINIQPTIYHVYCLAKLLICRGRSSFGIILATSYFLPFSDDMLEPVPVPEKNIGKRGT